MTPRRTISSVPVWLSGGSEVRGLCVSWPFCTVLAKNVGSLAAPWTRFQSYSFRAGNLPKSSQVRCGIVLWARRGFPSAALVHLFNNRELLDNGGVLVMMILMRPLYHPHPDEITVQGVLYALSDPVRVQIFMQLLSADCTKNCTTFMNIAPTPLPKSTLSQHFKVLREAGLIQSERRGVELQNRVRCNDIAKKFGAMVKAILEAYEKEHKASARMQRKKSVGTRRGSSASLKLSPSKR
jgi:DNA-binding transcriptional ArsR family regulator